MTTSNNTGTPSGGEVFATMMQTAVCKNKTQVSVSVLTDPLVLLTMTAASSMQTFVPFSHLSHTLLSNS